MRSFPAQNTPIVPPGEPRITADHIVWTQSGDSSELVTLPTILAGIEEQLQRLRSLDVPITSLEVDGLFKTRASSLILRTLLQKLVDQALTKTSVTPKATTPVLSKAASDTPVDPSTLIAVRECLRELDDNGDPYEMLPRDLYIDRIASEVCQINENVERVTQANEANAKKIELLPTLEEIRRAQSNVVLKCITAARQSLTVAEAFSAVETILCEHSNQIGAPGTLEIAARVQNENGLNPSLYGTTILQEIAGWKLQSATISDQINNLWIALDDVRNYLLTTGGGDDDGASKNFVVDFLLEFSNDRTEVTLRTMGYSRVPADAVPCYPAQMLVNDGKTTTSFSVDLPALSQSNTGQVLALAANGIDSSNTLTFTLSSCMTIAGEAVVKTKTTTVDSTCVKPPVTELTEALIDSTELGVTWAPPLDAVGVIYRTEILQGTTKISEVNDTVPSAGFTKLKPDTVYRVNVYANYACGTSQATSLVMKTMPAKKTTVNATFDNDTDKGEAYFKIRVNNGMQYQVLADSSLTIEAYEGDKLTIDVYTGVLVSKQQILGQLNVNNMVYRQIDARTDGLNHTFEIELTDSSTTLDWVIRWR